MNSEQLFKMALGIEAPHVRFMTAKKDMAPLKLLSVFLLPALSSAPH